MMTAAPNRPAELVSPSGLFLEKDRQSLTAVCLRIRPRKEFMTGKPRLDLSFVSKFSFATSSLRICHPVDHTVVSC